MTKKKQINMEPIGVVYDGNKLYRLTNDEWEKQIEMVCGKITVEEFEKILEGKPYTLLLPRKNPYG